MPVIPQTKTKLRIPGKQSVGKRPQIWGVRKPRPNRIVADVPGHLFKSMSIPFFIPEDVIMALLLPGKASCLQESTRVQTKLPHEKPLVAPASQTHCQQMYMIRHQTVQGARHVLTGKRMKQEKTKRIMEDFVKPSCRPVGDCQRPMDDGVPFIGTRMKAGEVPAWSWIHP